MSLTAQRERGRATEAPPPKSKLSQVLMGVLLAVPAGLLLFRDYETVWNMVGDWFFWILIAVAWLLPLIAQLLGRARKAAEGSGDVRFEELQDHGPEDLRDHGTRIIRPSVKRDYKPLRPR